MSMIKTTKCFATGVFGKRKKRRHLDTKSIGNGIDFTITRH
ncbi:hypothetical protein SpAn4DRAFT_2671 [Sporomusa ovata]|uniref:Uncharacterized protein n=1 Tax=Sporomusa ovata TaxID=2378 RepID=A0A0U1L280_9FIRM|nr:hypothetical protein SpAn4DRAFT_2671 [Sporomusa ovata]